MDAIPPAERALAARLADAAAAVIRPRFRTPLRLAHKADGSPVTDADRAAEAAMRAILAAERPAHGILGEELGAARLDAEWVWALDPIDGTTAFLTGKPSFGTLVALLHRGVPVLGVLDQPITVERWVGVRGQATTLNGRPVRSRTGVPLAEAALYATSPRMFRGADADAFARLGAAVGFTRYGADCYAYGLVAAGFVDLVVEADLQPYDFLALSPIIEGAGGVMTDWEGAPLTLFSGGRVVAAGSVALHAQALAVLRGAPPSP